MILSKTCERLGMSEFNLFTELDRASIINVATVPQRSPFRYPGGKTWFVPHLRQWFASMATCPRLLIEPFAGGGIVSLTTAFEQLASQVIMVERDNQVAAVWQTIMHGNAEWLANRIAEFEMTPTAVQKELCRENLTGHELAFQTILRNRINHGGILAPGSGIVKHGENGKGIKSRWYPQTLRNRITDIMAIRKSIQFIHGDGIDVIRDHASESDTVFFIDPPYTAAGKKAGKRLYACNDLNHDELFSLLETVQGDFLVTYDNTEGVKQLAVRHNLDMEAIAMKNTHHTEMTELVIGRNLDWMRRGRQLVVDFHHQLPSMQSD